MLNSLTVHPQVFCIVRAKAGQTALARLQTLWQSPVFRNIDASLRDKVELLEADLASPKCGLSATSSRTG